MALGSDHRHCKVCGRLCKPDEETCSKACREQRVQQLQTRRGLTYLLYGAIALTIIAYLTYIFH